MQAPLRVTFVNAINRHYADTQMFGIHFMPVWAYTLGAQLEDIPHVKLSLYDSRVQDESALQEADVFLFTGINQDAEAIFELHDKIRNLFPKAKVILGGPITWSFNTAGKIHELLKFDHVFIGDGEETLPDFIRNFQSKAYPQVIQTQSRFALEKSKPMSRRLMDPTIQSYYGGVVEVSRGCPFLCEFCDIRILPDNNRSHIKPASLIVEEVAHMASLGVKQILFACDNFIGNIKWAEEVCDKLIAWKRETGASVSLYTWLTINVSRNDELLKKLRLAGFDMFFIGVESFNQNSLLETAKAQNTAGELTEALRHVQSFGFIVVAGLIFGFDSDPDDISQMTLDGIMKSGLLSGDPSLLMALPGTPLYQRMKNSGRLRDTKINLGGYKYQTNIKYLRHTDKIKQDFLHFINVFTSGKYQYQRLLSYLTTMDSPNYMKPDSKGYADLRKLFKMTAKNPKHIFLLFKRIKVLLWPPQRLFYIAKALSYVMTHASSERPLWFYFKFWLFNWSNAAVKYQGLSTSDFDIDWVGEDFDIRTILPKDYDDAHEPIPIGKIKNQRGFTTQALKNVIQARKI